MTKPEKTLATVREALAGHLNTLPSDYLVASVFVGGWGCFQYDGYKISNCYYSYSYIVIGEKDSDMPTGMGGCRAGATTDVVCPVLGRVRLCSLNIDSGG